MNHIQSLKHALINRGVSEQDLMKHTNDLAQLMPLWENSRAFYKKFEEKIGIKENAWGEQERVFWEVVRQQQELARLKRAPIKSKEKENESQIFLRIEKAQQKNTPELRALRESLEQKIMLENLSFMEPLKTKRYGLDQKDDNGLTLISLMAMQGWDRGVLLMEKEGASVEAMDAVGNRPLHWACAMQHEKTVGALLFLGANPDAQNYAGLTPMMLALAKGRYDIALKLLNYGASLLKKDRAGNTMLHRAVLAKDLKMIDFLCEWGADPWAFNEQNISSVELARSIKECQKWGEKLKNEQQKKPMHRF